MTFRRICSCIAAAMLMLAPRLSSQSLDSLAHHAIEFSQHQLHAAISAIPDPTRFPRSTNPDGTWKTVNAWDWTSGFFPGCLWQMYEFTRDSLYFHAAARWTRSLDSLQWYRGTHDLGFMVNDSYGQGNRLCPSEEYKKVLLQTASTLALRYNPSVGCTRSWDQGQWQFPVIVDNLMNLELLFWASGHGGDARLKDIALSHALTTMRTHIRPDGSTYHLVDFDTTTGAVRTKQTVQGYADESAWARGQAWALYGFTAAYRNTHDVRLLEAAERTADYFIGHLPDDSVPYWDFRAPKIPDEPKDVSAAAIASSGLFELQALTRDHARQAAYAEAARHILASLCRAPYLAEGSSSMGLLNHAVGHRPAHSEVDVSIIYADYYFLEALHRFTTGIVH